MITEIIDRYRWISISENHDRWGIRFAGIRSDNLENFGPVPVEWTPETINRPICDFPNFRSNVTCFSRDSANKYRAILEKIGKWIELSGLSYNAFYCTKMIDAVDYYNTDVNLNKSEFGSFHSPEFVPVLRNRPEIADIDMFRIPQSISKRFVSERFMSEYTSGGFTGLEFTKVTLI